MPTTFPRVVDKVFKKVAYSSREALMHGGLSTSGSTANYIVDGDSYLVDGDSYIIDGGSTPATALTINLSALTIDSVLLTIDA